MSKEIWKSIPGYEGCYEISNHGRVKSLSRMSTGRNWKCMSGFNRPLKEKILTNKINGSGYYKVVLCKDGKCKNFNIHRLLAELFIPNPNNLQQVNHKDGDKSNYCLDNLEWVTPSENSLHAYNDLGIKPSMLGRYGKDNHSSKKVIQKTLSGEIIKTWDSAMDAVRTGFESSGICRCCKGEINTHKGFRWEYAND